MSASRYLSLPMIGHLLAHSRAQTTQRHTYLPDEPLRNAADGMGARTEEAPI
jgi:hypothetical protein